MDRAWSDAYYQRLIRERVPVAVTLELTRRCNLRCIHCYLGSQREQRRSAPEEMSTDQVKSVVDQLVEAGCLYLLITGGDPLMRTDFAEVYRYAREQGLVVTVFTDGVLLTDEIVELFRSHPPRLVEISLYGATAETYEAVTQVRGSYRRCREGIDRLVDAGVVVGLKTILMTINEHELEAMRGIATAYRVDFRMDAAIFPCVPDGDHGPLELRVDPAVGVDRDLADESVRASWQQYLDDRRDLPPDERLYLCGAGVTGFSVDPFGWASPCVMATHVRANLLEHGLDEVWNGELKQLQERRPRADYACSSCEMRAACTVCPAFNYLETGEEDVRSDYICASTAARWRHLTGNNGVGLPVVTGAVEGD